MPIRHYACTGLRPVQSGVVQAWYRLLRQNKARHDPSNGLCKHPGLIATTRTNSAQVHPCRAGIILRSCNGQIAALSNVILGFSDAPYLLQATFNLPCVPILSNDFKYFILPENAKIYRVWLDLPTKILFTVGFANVLSGWERWMFRSSRNGQGLVEYGLILVLAALVIIATLWLLGPNVGNVLASFMAD